MAKPAAITSQGQLDKLLTANKVVVVDFWADWCGPCRAIAPLYESLCASESKPGRVAFGKVDVDSQQGIAQKYGVTAMPTFLIFQNGSVRQTIRGADSNGLRSAVTAAVASAGVGKAAGGGSTSFESKGHVLGSGNTVRARTTNGSGGGGIAAGLTANLPSSQSLGAMIPGGFLGTIVRFFGLYFSTLFSLDPKQAAEMSQFRVDTGQRR